MKNFGSTGFINTLLKCIFVSINLENFSYIVANEVLGICKVPLQYMPYNNEKYKHTTTIKKVIGSHQLLIAIKNKYGYNIM